MCGGGGGGGGGRFLIQTKTQLWCAVTDGSVRAVGRHRARQNAQLTFGNCDALTFVIGGGGTGIVGTFWCTNFGWRAGDFEFYDRLIFAGAFARAQWVVVQWVHDGGVLRGQEEEEMQSHNGDCPILRLVPGSREKFHTKDERWGVPNETTRPLFVDF